MRLPIRDLLAGAIFAGFGLAFAVGAASYQMGTALSMGPGYFPLLVGGLLVLFGVLIVAKGFIAGEWEPIGKVPWKAVALLTGAVVFFGVTVRGLGIVPSLFVAALLSGLAGERPGIVLPTLIAFGLTLLSVLIFVVALQLRLPLLGPWIPL
ncbi:MAG TPA: tripartite tricarboxylate transporter TctB family protein [Acidimicrobiia bacterium]|nr:tripartite tricarboxylate transporter TctB family protein [Acidimicrobiia bacterium]